MTELVIAEFDVDDLSRPALQAFKAMVTFAQKRAHIKLHTMSLANFCRFAGLPYMSRWEIVTLLNEARKALAVIEIVDTSLPEREDLPSASWPVFSELRVTSSHVSFEVYDRTFDDRLIASLPLPRHQQVRFKISK